MLSEYMVLERPKQAKDSQEFRVKFISSGTLKISSALERECIERLHAGAFAVFLATTAIALMILLGLP
jgi:hypothetical protein